jgi:putative ABC transport system permease protein
VRGKRVFPQEFCPNTLYTGSARCRKDILMQFLVETIVLSVVGAVTGVALGISGAKIVSLATAWPMLIPWAVSATVVALSVLLGLVFGVYPATKAAAIDPIVALRSD